MRKELLQIKRIGSFTVRLYETDKGYIVEEEMAIVLPDTEEHDFERRKFASLEEATIAFNNA